MPEKRIRPYKKTIHIGTCQICSGPIMSNRRDRTATAVACSRACLGRWHARRLRERPIRTHQVKRVIMNEGYAFLRVSRLDTSLRELALRMVSPRAKYVQEHRIVMAGILHRPLERGEFVHHKDGDKLNNDPSNLELWVRGHGDGIRATDLLCPHCGKSYA